MNQHLQGHRLECAGRMLIWIVGRFGTACGDLFADHLDGALSARGDQLRVDLLGEAFVDGVGGRAAAKDFRDRFHMMWLRAVYCDKQSRAK